MLKIGDKVRNIHNNKLEGKITRSLFGASVSGFYINENGQRVHFKTVGGSIKELEKDWKRIRKFKYSLNKD